MSSVHSSWQPSGRDDSLPPSRESAVNEQNALAATRAGDGGVCLVWHGTVSPTDESDHEPVGSQHVSHALSWIVRCASLRPAELPASKRKSRPKLA